MQIPREIWVGYGVMSYLKNLCAKILNKEDGNIVLITDSTVKKLVVDGEIESLERKGFNVHELLIKDSSLDEVGRIVEECRSIKPDLFLGVGGGKVIDVAKLSSMRSNSLFISVPTVASHDGITSPMASLKQSGKPFSFYAQAPIAILADIKIIRGAPFRYTAAGCGDLISNFTAVRDWKLAYKLHHEYYGEYAASLSLTSAKHIVTNAELISKRTVEGIRILVEALIGSGVAMSIAGTSRPCSGSEHLFSHALDIISPGRALHGEQCGVGSIMMAYLHGLNWRKIRKTLKKVGAPVNSSQLGVKEEDIVKALTMAHKIRPERYTVLGEKGLTHEAAEDLARKTKVIE